MGMCWLGGLEGWKRGFFIMGLWVSMFVSFGG